MADEPALSVEDYQQLHGLLLSDDADTRARGLSIAKKLTPSEQQAFFDYQQQANKGKGELTRVDDQSPAILGAVGAGSAVAKAVAAPGLSIVARGVAGAKAATDQAAPIVKYELVKRGLHAIGLPEPIPTAVGYLASGYRRGAAPAAAAETPATTAVQPSVKAILSDVELARQEFAAGRLPKSVLDTIERHAARAAAPTAAALVPTAAPATAPVATPAPTSAPVSAPAPAPAPTPTAAPVVAPVPAVPATAIPAAPVMSAPKIASDIWKAARDAKVILSPEQNIAAFQAVKSGLSPAEAVAKVATPPMTPAEAFNARFGLKIPTEAETKFSKGMRGKPAGSD